MDYSSNLIISPTEKRFQALYATQLYGTFFGIFGKCITMKEEDELHLNSPRTGNTRNTNLNSKHKYRFLKEIEFAILNYKGPINLTLKAHFQKPEIVEVKVDGNILYRKINLVIKVKASPKAKPYKRNIILNFEKWPEFHGGLRFEENDYLIIRRELIPIKQNSSDIVKKLFKNGKFDSENYERDGAYYKKKEQIIYTDDYKFIDDLVDFPSDSCVPSINKIVIS